MVKSLELVSQECCGNVTRLTYALTYHGKSAKVGFDFVKSPFMSEPILLKTEVLEGEVLKQGTLDNFDDIRAAVRIDLADRGLSLQI